MKFKKIDDSQFQCLLYEQDLEENDITLDDFFRNNTQKIHKLLDVIIEEAQKDIGVTLKSGMMSLQLAPQPNKTILLTVSSSDESLGTMLKRAGEHAKEFADTLDKNVIKQEDLDALARTIHKAADQQNTKGTTSGSAQKKEEVQDNFIKANQAVFRFGNMDEFEEFCTQCPKTWGIQNAIYKEHKTAQILFIMERGRSSVERYKLFWNELMEFATFDSSKKERISYIREHYDAYIKKNAINTVKKYL